MASICGAIRNAATALGTRRANSSPTKHVDSVSGKNLTKTGKRESTWILRLRNTEHVNARSKVSIFLCVNCAYIKEAVC